MKNLSVISNRLQFLDGKLIYYSDYKCFICSENVAYSPNSLLYYVIILQSTCMYQKVLPFSLLIEQKTLI